MLKVLPFLLLSYRNMELDDLEERAILKEFEQVRERIEYRVAQELKDALLQTFDLKLDEIEISLIAIYFYPIERTAMFMYSAKISLT